MQEQDQTKAVERFRAGTILEPQLHSQASKAKAIIAALVSRSSGFKAVVNELLEVAASKPGSRLEVIIPPHIASALERGEMTWMEASDGSGLIATVVKDGKIIHNARFRFVPTETDGSSLKLAMAQAQTQAMFRQIIAKLDCLDEKLELALANQRAEWTGRIASGIEACRKIFRESGYPEHLVADLSNAKQSLEQGLHTGLEQLREFVKSKKMKPRLTEHSPSKKRGTWLDRVRGDISWLYAACEAIAACESKQGRPLAAREAFVPLRQTLIDLEQPLQTLRLYSAYSQPRESFWKNQLPVFTDNLAVPSQIVLELPAPRSEGEQN